MKNSSSSSQRSHRKDEHLALARAFYRDHKVNFNDFDTMRLVRPTLPETTVNENNLQTDFIGAKISAPIFINAMTGGSKKAKQINHDLGLIAHQQKIPVALGSGSILSHEPELINTFSSVRDENTDGPVLINVNPFTSLETVKLLKQELEPVAVQIHLNAVQELIMPEGDRDFRWLNRLISLREALDIPVIIKEVGFGFDLNSLQLLEQNGFTYVDVAGSGGTDFGWIENFRRPKRNYDYLVESQIGISTVKSLENAQQTKLTYFASGGIRHPLDILKSLVLGTQAVGISNAFLQVLNETGVEGLNETISIWKEQLAGLIALFGANNLAEVSNIKYEKNSLRS